MQSKLTARLLSLAVAGTAALSMLVPASASASLGSALKDVTACDPDASVAQPFAAWGDNLFYKLAPGGDFEAGSPAWTLSSGAQIADGNSDQQVGGDGDSRSLVLPPGASATSPVTCVGLAEPMFRLFASGPRYGLVYAQAVYGSVSVPAGVAAGGPWALSLPMFTGAGIAGREFSIRLTNKSAATMRVDDVYIDPYRRS